MAAIADATDQELEQYRQAIVAEQERRRTLATGADQMDKLVRDMLAASGQVEGGVWVQPTGYENAYPKGWVCTHNGNEWTSNIAGNTLEPGVSGWTVTPVEGEPPPEYKDPQGYQDAYNEGDLVTFEGDVYRCLRDGTTWSPRVAPTVWELVS